MLLAASWAAVCEILDRSDLHTREEFDAACREMAEAGVPLNADLDQAWRDVQGWRVNYDTVLVILAGFFMAPYAPWSSDCSIRFRVRSRSIAKAANVFQRFVQFVRPPRRRRRPTRSSAHVG